MVESELFRIALGGEERGMSSRGSARLDRSLDGAILEAALAAVSEHGYDRASMDDVAARAGVGKAAIYRRWASKEAVVADAIAHWRRQLGSVRPPNTGTLRGDVEAVIAAVPDYDANDKNMLNVVVGVATAASRNPLLAAALEDVVLSQSRRMLQVVLDQAVARGEISGGRDLSLLPDAVLGLNIIRVMAGRPVDRVYVRRVLEDVVLPLACAPAEI